MLSAPAQQLWNWISSNVMDENRTNWCRAGTNSGPTYPTIVDEPIAQEVVDACFGGYGHEHAIEFVFLGAGCNLYAVAPVQKPDKVRGWTMNFWMRQNGSWGTLRVNLHVHLRMAERMKAVEGDDGFTAVKNKKKKVVRQYT
ncbi:MAG TPA: hypothetical protein VIP05_25250 [Burkholderiaceae bacterium]